MHQELFCVWDVIKLNNEASEGSHLFPWVVVKGAAVNTLHPCSIIDEESQTKLHLFIDKHI